MVIKSFTKHWLKLILHSYCIHSWMKTMNGGATKSQYVMKRMKIVIDGKKNA